MRCPIETQENLELVLDYAASKTPEFEQHLQVCPRCREAVAGQQSARAALDVWEAPEISASFNRRLYERIDKTPSWRERLAQAGRMLLVWRGVPIAAAACLIVTAGLVLEQGSLGARHHRDATPNPPAIEATQPEQVVHELDDMEMLHNFDRSVRSGGKSEL